MKQPELGKKISELRKAKGLTQEELVDKCNISVRTIQRIEAGEVTPRSYTVKTIMAALDYDLDIYSNSKNTIVDKFIQWIKDFLFIDLDENKSSKYLIKQLNIAWIAGIIYFVTGFFEGAADFWRYEEDRMIFSNAIYIIIKAVVLLSFILFQRGFILIGWVFRNYLLKIMSFILIFGVILLIAHDIASVYAEIGSKFILGASALSFGAIGIIYGISLNRLKPRFGNIAKYAGIFEIISGCFLLTIVLAFVGLILLIPAELFEIIILFKATAIIKKLNLTDN